MTANRKQVTMFIVVGLLLSVTGLTRFFGFKVFGIEALVGVAALLPLVLVGGLVWFGREVLTSLRRIESAIEDTRIAPEFIHGS